MRCGSSPGIGLLWSIIPLLLGTVRVCHRPTGNAGHWDKSIMASVILHFSVAALFIARLWDSLVHIISNLHNPSHSWSIFLVFPGVCLVDYPRPAPTHQARRYQLFQMQRQSRAWPTWAGQVIGARLTTGLSLGHWHLLCPDSGPAYSACALITAYCIVTLWWLEWEPGVWH